MEQNIAEHCESLLRVSRTPLAIQGLKKQVAINERVSSDVAHKDYGRDEFGDRKIVI